MAETQPNYTLEKIIWHDAHGGRDSWEHTDELNTEPKPIFSVGYVVKEDSTIVAIAPHIGIEQGGEKEFCCGTMVIPKSCIVNRKKLR